MLLLSMSLSAGLVGAFAVVEYAGEASQATLEKVRRALNIVGGNVVKVRRNRIEELGTVQSGWSRMRQGWKMGICW